MSVENLLEDFSNNLDLLVLVAENYIAAPVHQNLDQSSSRPLSRTTTSNM